VQLANTIVYLQVNKCPVFYASRRFVKIFLKIPPLERVLMQLNTNKNPAHFSPVDTSC
jgi:hypothetical protein